MRSIKELTTKNIVKISVFTAVTAAFFFMFYYYPFLTDDLWFLSHIKDAATESGHPESLWHGLFGAGKWHYIYDNSRLANTVMLFVLLLPKWISAFISTVAFAITYALTLKFAKVSSMVGFAITTLLICILIPWQDMMFVTMLTMNYVWPGALMLLCILWFIKGKHASVTSFILGFIMGLSHECFSIPLLFAFCIALLLKKRESTPWNLLLMAGLLIGIILLCTSPYFISRMALCETRGTASNRLHSLISEIPYYMYLGVWLIFAIQKKIQRMAFSTIQIICLSLGFAVIPIHIFCFIPRATYPLILISIIGVLNLPWDKFCHLKKWLKYSTCMLIFIFLACHLSLACSDIYRLNKEMDNIFYTLKNENPGQNVIYADITYPHQLSPLSFCKMSFWNTTQQLTYKWYAEITGLPRCGVVPKVLKDYTGQYDEVIPGNAGAKLYKDLAILPLVNFPGHVDRSKIYARLAGRERPVGSEYFVGKDGKEYLVIVPFIRISDFSHKIQQINVYQ